MVTIKCIATIKREHESESCMFTDLEGAREWLDSVNNNLQYTTYIDIYDEKWKKMGSIPHTKAAEN